MPQVLGRGVYTGGFVSWAIVRLTGSNRLQLSHVEYRMDADWHEFIRTLWASCRAPRPGWLVNAYAAIIHLPAGDYGTIGARSGSGVAIRPTNYITPRVCRNFHVDLTTNQKHSVMAAALQKLGDGYGYLDVVGDMAHLDLSRKGQEDCSHYMAETLNEGRPVIGTGDGAALITPRDFAISPEIVWD